MAFQDWLQLATEALQVSIKVVNQIGLSIFWEILSYTATKLILEMMEN